MPRQQNETTCDECEAPIRYTVTPSSSDDRRKFIVIEDVVRECLPDCPLTDAIVMEAIEMEASEPYDERED